MMIESQIYTIYSPYSNLESPMKKQVLPLNTKKNRIEKR